MREINVDIIHEELFKEKPLLAFDPNRDYGSWKKEIEKKYYELLGLEQIEKCACPLNIQIEEVVEEETYTRIRYVFESEKNSFVPCYLLIPKIKKDKYPVMVCMQGHTTGFHISIGKSKYEQDAKTLATSQFAIQAIKRGYAALCIEQRGMGERTTPRQDRGRALTCGCYHTAFTALLLGRTLIGERVWDISQGIDSLSEFADEYRLDLSDITILGNSGGGTATYYAACYDKRIKIAVPCCSICTYKDSIGAMWHCSCNYIPRIAEYMDMGELACLIAPRKLLICNGEIDPIFPLKGTKEVFSVIKQIYEKENVPQNTKLVVIPNAPHYFDEETTFSELEKIKNI